MSCCGYDILRRLIVLDSAGINGQRFRFRGRAGRRHETTSKRHDHSFGFFDCARRPRRGRRRLPLRFSAPATSWRRWAAARWMRWPVHSAAFFIKSMPAPLYEDAAPLGFAKAGARDQMARKGLPRPSGKDRGDEERWPLVEGPRNGESVCPIRSSSICAMRGKPKRAA